jgi:RecJ-like exonuclease
MKKVELLRIVLMLIAVCAICCSVSGCKYAGRYTDDLIRNVDDKLDDGLKYKSKGPKRALKEKICSECNGTGVVYIYGYPYECSKCGGDGKIWFN